MSDKKVTAILAGDTRIYGSVAMAKTDRVQAVRIALELIKASCPGNVLGFWLVL